MVRDPILETGGGGDVLSIVAVISRLCLRFLLVHAVALVVAAPVPAQAQAGGDFEVHGFVLGNLASRFGGDHPPGPEGGTFLLGEGRARLDVGWWADAVELSAVFKADAIYDGVASDLDADLREAYLDYSAGPIDVRGGRQIVTWGVGDLLFINDVFPKDWVSFFSGRPLEYLKIGADGLRVRYSSPAMNGEVVVMPRFQPDNLPVASRFFFYDPFAGVAARHEVQPPTSLENTEVAARAYRRLGGLDLAGYAYRGFWRSPGALPDDPSLPTQLTFFYPELSVYGASAQRSLLRGVLSLELGYYDSRQDRSGTDPAVPNSQTRFLIGYQRQLAEELTVGLQYYAELMQDYAAYRSNLPEGFPAQGRYRDTVTVRLTKMLKHQTWRLSLFAFVSPADADYLLIPEASYRLSDRLSATGGVNVFGGEHGTTFLGQFDRNDNAYAALRFDF